MIQQCVSYQPTASIPVTPCLVCEERRRAATKAWSKLENQRVFEELLAGLPPKIGQGMLLVFNVCMLSFGSVACALDYYCTA